MKIFIMNRPDQIKQPSNAQVSLLCEIIGPVNPNVLQLGEVLEMQGPMLIVVESQRRVDLHIDWSLINAAERASHEAIVPHIILRHQEVTADLVTEEQLAFLSHIGGESLWLV